MTDHTAHRPHRGLARLSTSALSDALDRAGRGGQLPGLRPLRPGPRMAGPAFTVRYQPAGFVPGSVGDFVDDVPAGAVVVIDNGGRTDATVWGDLMTTVASRRGLAGTVIDGVCRDVDRAAELGYPVFSRGAYMRTGKDRVQLAAVGEPVGVAGCLVRPGDLVVGDSDGVVVIPAEAADEVLGYARVIDEAEQGIREALARGVPLRQARAESGYHQLQRHQGPGAR